MNKVAAQLSFIREHYIDSVIGKEILPSVTQISPIDNPTAIVCDFFLRKATKSLDAACILCEASLAEDALILGRTIFELCLYLQTIASADTIEQRRHNALCFIYDGDRQRVAKVNALLELKKQGKCLSWIQDIEDINPVFETIPMPNDFVPLKNLKAMATDLGGKWECWYHFLYWSLSKLAHPSGLGSHTFIQACDQEVEAFSAITVAWTMHYFLTDLVLSLVDLEKLRPQLEECVKGAILRSKCADNSVS